MSFLDDQRPWQSSPRFLLPLWNSQKMTEKELSLKVVTDMQPTQRLFS